jgi:hypothetical protein
LLFTPTLWFELKIIDPLFFLKHYNAVFDGFGSKLGSSLKLIVLFQNGEIVFLGFYLFCYFDFPEIVCVPLYFSPSVHKFFFSHSPMRKWSLSLWMTIGLYWIIRFLVGILSQRIIPSSTFHGLLLCHLRILWLLGRYGIKFYGSIEILFLGFLSWFWSCFFKFYWKS